MKTPKINTKKFAAALAPIALAGAMMAPTAAASTPATAPSPAATAPIEQRATFAGAKRFGDLDAAISQQTAAVHAQLRTLETDPTSPRHLLELQTATSNLSSSIAMRSSLLKAIDQANQALYLKT
jgi:hypothetical protein